MKFWIPIVIVFGLCFNVSSQKYSFVKKSVEDGLIQSQVKHIVEDSSGNLWIATKGGLSIYNGIEFQTFGKREGLNFSRLNHLLLTEQGVLISGEGGVTLKKGNNFLDFELSEELQGVFIYESIEFMGNLYFATNKGVAIADFDEKVVRYPESKNVHTEVAAFRSRCFYQRDSSLLVGTEDGVLEILSNGVIENYIEGLDVLGIGERKNELVISVRKYGLAIVSDSVTWITTDEGLPTSFVRDFVVNSETNILYGVTGGGFFTLDEDNVVQVYNESKGLEFSNLNTLSFDHENNLWLGSEGQGIFRFTGTDFMYYDFSGGFPFDIVMSAHQINDKLIVGTYGQGAFVTSPDFETMVEIEGLDKNVWSITSSPGIVHFATNSGLYQYHLNTGNLVNYPSDARLISLKYLESTQELLVGGAMGVFRQKSIGADVNLVSGKVRNVRTIIETKKGVFLGAQDGVFQYENGILTKIVSVNNVYVLQEFNDKLVIGASDGLFLHDRGNLIKLEFDKQYSSNAVNFVSVYGNKLWLGTNNGLYMLELYDSAIVSTRRFDTKDGMHSIECNLNSSIIPKGSSMLIFGTNSGMMKANLDGLLQAKIAVPKLGISGVKLFYRYIRPEAFMVYNEFGDNILEFKYNQNNFSFEYAAVNLVDHNSVEYTYTLEGYDDGWVPVTKNRFATYTNLSFGEYSFRVKARNINGEFSSERVQRIRILRPWFLSWWFIGLSVIAISVVVYLVIRARRAIRKKTAEVKELDDQRRLLSLEQQSLNSSMNRHFIFNALNSVQYFINSQDRRSANKYLTNFAKLIRKNLDSTSEGATVSLEEELERLELYIGLEQMRFQDSFEYELNVDPRVDVESIQIPPMMLQPFVENSIIHGILPKKTKGKIKLSITKEVGAIKFVISDNGVGFTESLRSKGVEESHKSKGTSITASRIDLLRRTNKQNLTLVGPRNLSINGQLLGTEVVITIKD